MSSICLFEQDNMISNLETMLKDSKNLEMMSVKISKLKKSYDINMAKIEKQLRDANIDVDSINVIIKKYVHKVKISNNPVEVAKSLVENFQAATTEVMTSLPRDIAWSILTLMVVMCLNTFLLLVILVIGTNLGIPPQICMYALVIFVAPIVEEYSKYISIKNNYTGAYFIIFNMSEFSSYVLKMLAIGYNLAPAILIRLTVVMMHAITTYIQYHMRKNAKEKDKEEASKLGLIIGIIIHFFWNLGAVVMTL